MAGAEGLDASARLGGRSQEAARDAFGPSRRQALEPAHPARPCSTPRVSGWGMKTENQP